MGSVETTKGEGVSKKVMGTVGCDEQGKVRVWVGGMVWV